MNPRSYFDIEIRGAASAGAGQIPAVPAMTRLVHVLHGVFSTHPGKFAIALPRMKTGDIRHPGHVIRIFADTRNELDVVADALNANERVRGYASFAYSKSVPQNFVGPWYEFRRYRIPGTGSRLDKCRQFRLEASEKLPHFRSKSASNGNQFVIFVDRRNGAASLDCAPDNYGLSVPSRAFALPMVQ